MIVITGLGTINALGRDVASFWSALCRGDSAIAPLAGRFPQDAGLVAALVPDPLPMPDRESSLLPRVIRLGLIAAAEALRQAELEAPADPGRVGVVLGTTAGEILEVEEALAADPLLEHLPAARLFAFEKSEIADTLARTLGLAGPRRTVSTACASGASAILLAKQMIECGEADVVLAGGAETLVRLTLAGFRALRALDPGPCRPFDARRRGLTLGEGAGMVVLERDDSARARGVPPLGILLGGAQTTDAHHLTAPPEDGSGAARAVRAALERAEVTPGEVDHVHAHGTGTPQNDRAEATALHRALGSVAARCPVISIKGALGHTLGAAGAIGALATLLSLRHGLVPPTAGLQEPDPELGLDVVQGRARQVDARVALASSFGFGGANAVLCFRRADA